MRKFMGLINVNKMVKYKREDNQFNGIVSKIDWICQMELPFSSTMELRKTIEEYKAWWSGNFGLVKRFIEDAVIELTTILSLAKETA